MEIDLEVAETYISGNNEEIRIIEQIRETVTQRDTSGNYEQYTGMYLYIGGNGLKYYHDGVCKGAKKEKFNIVNIKETQCKS